MANNEWIALDAREWRGGFPTTKQPYTQLPQLTPTFYYLYENIQTGARYTRLDQCGSLPSSNGLATTAVCHTVFQNVTNGNDKLYDLDQNPLFRGITQNTPTNTGQGSGQIINGVDNLYLFGGIGLLAYLLLKK